MPYGELLFHPHNCLNTKRPFAHACVKCVEFCPHQAISEMHNLDSARCTECGLCMAVCPSDGIVDRFLGELADYVFQSGEIILNCPEAEPQGWEIPCLGIMDRDFWLTLLVLASEKKVRLLTGRCAECPDKVACQNSVTVFKDIHAQWPDHPGIEIVVKPDDGAGPERDLPRNPDSGREIGLRDWRELGRKKVEGILPGLVAEETYNIPLTRRWLTQALERNQKYRAPFLALTVSDTCTNCGVCSAICPQGALKKRENGQVLQLVLEPVQCVQCGRCVEICQPKALALEAKQISAGILKGKILLHEGIPRYCERCGKQIFNNSVPPLCLACATQDPEQHNLLF